MLFSSLHPRCLVMCKRTFDLHISEEKDERKVKDTCKTYYMYLLCSCACLVYFCLYLLSPIPSIMYGIYIPIHLLVLNGKL